MKTKRHMQQGSILLKEKPFVYTLSSKVRTEYCDFCFKKAKLLKCSNCHYVYYCGKACQKDGWSVHKMECMYLRKIAPKILPDAARMLSRLILTLRKGGDLIRSFYWDNCFRMYKDLMSHYKDIKTDSSRMEHFTSLYGVLIEFFQGESLPNSAELIGMYGRICINSFNILDPELQSLGTGMYLGASVIDHSCSPNALATFEGTTLYIRALQSFSYIDWSEIHISYIDVLNTAKDRRKELESLYYFNCECPTCLSVEPPEIHAAACPNIFCDHPVNVELEKCDKCNQELSLDFVQEYNLVMEFSDLQLQNMKQLAYFDVCEVCLIKQQGILHKFNLKHVKVLDLAFHSSIDFQKWDAAKKYAVELIDAYYKYYGKFHPLTGLVHLKLGKILLYENSLQGAVNHLKVAYDIIKVTHGSNSQLIRNDLVPLLHQARIESGLS